MALRLPSLSRGLADGLLFIIQSRYFASGSDLRSLLVVRPSEQSVRVPEQERDFKMVRRASLAAHAGIFRNTALLCDNSSRQKTRANRKETAEFSCGRVVLAEEFREGESFAPFDA